MNTPDFYIASSDGFSLEVPHKIFIIKQLKGNYRDDLLLVRVEPALDGRRYGLLEAELRELLIVPRHDGDTFSDVLTRPVAVNVARLLGEEPEAGSSVQTENIRLLAWGKVFRNEDEAKNSK